MSRTYVLKIENETGKSVAKKIGGAGGVNADSSGGEKPKATTAEKAMQKLFSYGTVKSFVNQAASFGVSTVQLRTGSSEAQQRANFYYNVTQRGVSMLETVAGAFFVSGGNPLAAGLGLLISAAHTAIDIGQKIDRLQIEHSIENVSRDLSSQRATVSGSRFQNVTQG